MPSSWRNNAKYVPYVFSDRSGFPAVLSGTVVVSKSEGLFTKWRFITSNTANDLFSFPRNQQQLKKSRFCPLHPLAAALLTESLVTPRSAGTVLQPTTGLHAQPGFSASFFPTRSERITRFSFPNDDLSGFLSCTTMKPACYYGNNKEHRCSTTVDKVLIRRKKKKKERE